MSNFKRVLPYESHLIAAADEVIRLRGLRRDVLMQINEAGMRRKLAERQARQVIAELHELRRIRAYVITATFALGLLAGSFL